MKPPLRPRRASEATIVRTSPNVYQCPPRPSPSPAVDSCFWPYSREQGPFLFLRPPSVRLSSTTTRATKTTPPPAPSRGRAHPPQRRWVRGSFLGAQLQIHRVGRPRRGRRRRQSRWETARAEACFERRAQGRGEVWGGDGEGRRGSQYADVERTGTARTDAAQAWDEEWEQKCLQTDAGLKGREGLHDVCEHGSSVSIDATDSRGIYVINYATSQWSEKAVQRVSRSKHINIAFASEKRRQKKNFFIDPRLRKLG